MISTSSKPVLPKFGIMQIIAEYNTNPVLAFERVDQSIQDQTWLEFVQPAIDAGVQTATAKRIMLRAGIKITARDGGPTEAQWRERIETVAESMNPTGLVTKLRQANPGDWIDRRQAQILQDELARIMCNRQKSVTIKVTSRDR